MLVFVNFGCAIGIICRRTPPQKIAGGSTNEAASCNCKPELMTAATLRVAVLSEVE